MNIKIAPSILSADFADLKTDIKRISHADMLHIDVMDFHFVPNLTIGPPVVKAIRQVSDKFLDCHLMIENSHKWVDNFIEAGANSITFHLGTCPDEGELIDYLHSKGCHACLSVKPKEDPALLLPWLDKLDMILIMTVEPGFGGQAFMPEMLKKVIFLKNELKILGRQDVDLEVDGGITLENADQVWQAGANVLVSGTGVFNHKPTEESASILTPNQVIDKMHEIGDI